MCLRRRDDTGRAGRQSAAKKNSKTRFLAGAVRVRARETRRGKQNTLSTKGKGPHTGATASKYRTSASPLSLIHI